MTLTPDAQQAADAAAAKLKSSGVRDGMNIDPMDFRLVPPMATANLEPDKKGR